MYLAKDRILSTIGQVQANQHRLRKQPAFAGTNPVITPAIPLHLGIKSKSNRMHKYSGDH
jgi:hypothetical protein